MTGDEDACGKDKLVNGFERMEDDLRDDFMDNLMNDFTNYLMNYFMDDIYD